MLLKKCENNFYGIIKDISNQEDKNKILEAYDVARDAHKGQKRKSGEAYLTHPLAVGLSLWRKFGNVDLFIAGLLHDTVEDCENISMQFIYEKFGNNIGFIVDSVTKTEMNFFNSDKKFDDIRDKMLYGGLQNIGCILVKLADREHNLSTLGFMPKHKQVKKSFESQALYLPLMNIVDFNTKGISVKKSEEKLKNYLKQNNIQTSKELKNSLFNFCFNDFTEDIFDIVYNNSNQVVWKIEDKKLFDGLVSTGWFDSESVHIKKIETTGKGLFRVYFIFKGGSTFDFSNGKISILNSNFIS